MIVTIENFFHQERQRRQTEKKEKKKKNVPGKLQATTQSLEEFVQSEDKPVPLLIEKCMNFIEEEGLDSEGIYRVPGNRAHVDLLFQKFDEGSFRAFSIRFKSNVELR